MQRLSPDFAFLLVFTTSIRCLRVGSPSGAASGTLGKRSVCLETPEVVFQTWASAAREAPRGLTQAAWTSRATRLEMMQVGIVTWIPAAQTGLGEERDRITQVLHDPPKRKREEAAVAQGK